MPLKTDLSIIILSYNTLDLLRECLLSIAKTEVSRFKIETIVVDNASQDGSAEMVEKEFTDVVLIKNKSNIGFAAGNNLALSRASGRYTLFLNSDTVLPVKIFPEILEFLDKETRVGALTVRLNLRNGEMDPDCHRGFPTPWASLTYFLGLEKIFPKSRLFSQYHQSFLPLEEIHEIDSACGAFLMVRKDALREIEKWDEDYFFYGEDIDFCYRLKQKGWKIIFYPQVAVLHYKGASSGLRREAQDITQADRKTRLRAARASIEAMKIFYQKFYSQKYPRLLTEVILCGIQIKGWMRFLSHFLRY